MKEEGLEGGERRGIGVDKESEWGGERKVYDFCTSMLYLQILEEEITPTLRKLKEVSYIVVMIYT